MMIMMTYNDNNAEPPQLACADVVVRYHVVPAEACFLVLSCEQAL
jgi:hypothetical protein